MSTTVVDERQQTVPAAAWWLAGACLLTQVLYSVDQGLRDPETGVVVSVVLGVALVTWVAAGVLKARTGRVIFAWVLVAVAFVGELTQLWTRLVDGASTATVVLAFGHLGSTIALGFCLAWYTSSSYSRWQSVQDHSVDAGPSHTSLLLVAVLVGVLGGVTDPGGDGGLGEERPGFHLRIDV